MAYTIDDHEAGDNNANSKSPSIKIANQAYREVIPVQLAEGTGTEGGIWHSFQVSSVLFIMLDLRTFKDSTDSEGRTSVFGDK